MRTEASEALSRLQHDAEVRITEQQRSNAALQHERQQLLRELARVRAAAEGSTRAENDSLREQLSASEAELSAVRRERNTLLKTMREHMRARESVIWDREDTQRGEMWREKARPEVTQLEVAQPGETRCEQANASSSETREDEMTREQSHAPIRTAAYIADDESANTNANAKVALRAKLSALSARSASLLQNRNR